MFFFLLGSYPECAFFVHIITSLDPDCNLYYKPAGNRECAERLGATGTITCFPNEDFSSVPCESETIVVGGLGMGNTRVADRAGCENYCRG